MAPNNTRTSSEVPYLRHDDERLVLVHPADNDTFMLPRREAVAACMNHEQFKSFDALMRSKWQGFCQRIREWCVSHGDVVRAVLSRRDRAEYLLLVITNGSSHNFELDDSVSEFDLELRAGYPEFPCTVMTVPQEVEGGISAFVDEKASLELHASPSAAQGGR